ncbi:MAG TPA: MmpS family transport accessory protein [Mycobacterium sp.]|uniref:MmpS family transport accessory protein n=1 Tax=Mycobacterium sp. TaxID=1785 RepID=UPI002CC9E72F|nr:MmpS family transport accessory protein [Mycobacterium sp.]HME76795.1 MmpS family transport accessory protein [Mycobacterium sp.]
MTMPTRPVKARTGSSVLLAVLTAVATTIGMCGVANATGPQTQVTYQLSGSAPVADYISYQTDSGQTGQTQQAHVPLPWQTQFTVTGSKVFVLSAQSPGSITCTILVDGKVVSQATANGAPARTVCTH